MKDDVEKLLIDKKIKSGGHCGTYVPDILNQLGIDYKTAKPILNGLFKEGKIIIKPGSKGKLIFWKPRIKSNF